LSLKSQTTKRQVGQNKQQFKHGQELYISTLFFLQDGFHAAWILVNLHPPTSSSNDFIQSYHLHLLKINVLISSSQPPQSTPMQQPSQTPK